MAQGDAKLFRDFALKSNQGDYSDADTSSIAFLSDTYSAVDIEATNPQLSGFTVTSGGNISAVTNLAGYTFTRATTTITFDATDPSTFPKNASNTADVRSLLVYNNTSTNYDAYQVFDLTSDGTTPLDLVNNDLVFNFGASGITTATTS